MKALHLSLLIMFFATLNAVGQMNDKNAISGEQREQYIQKAMELRKNEDYGSAVQQLDSILLRNASDAPILLFKGDLLLQGKQYAQAAATYRQLLPMDYERTITQINLSYALFMNHQPLKALNFAEAAWEQNKTNTSAVVNYFNAMLWNSKTKQAEEFLQQQDSLLKPAQQLVLKARLYTTRGDYSNGLKYYDSLVKSYPDKYYVSEYAEVLLGKKEMQQSMLAMESAKQLFSENEYKAYQQKLKSSRMQNAGTEFVYFKDVAKNVRIENSIWWQQREGGKFRLRLSAGVSNVTSINDEKTKSQFAHVSVTERWNKAWSGQTDIHLQLIQPANEKGFSGITGKQTLQYQPNDRRMFGVYYGSEILNYTASILGENIRSNDAGYVTHIMLSGKSGIYSQGSAGVLSDNNKRYMFFGSLYHLFRTEPTIKGGANFSVLHFSDNTVKTYFSPDRYLNTEVFVDYISALPMLSRFYVQMQAAAGMQKIEKQNWEPAFRLQTELGLRLNHFETALKYQTSNVASNTGTGYKFNWYVLRLMWKW